MDELARELLTFLQLLAENDEPICIYIIAVRVTDDHDN